MGAWSELFNLFNTPLEQFMTFIQTLALVVAAGMAGYYKLREMFADVQEDQMFSQKTKKVFIALIFIFIIPTLIKIIKTYLM